jgi:hypothetical protein
LTQTPAQPPTKLSVAEMRRELEQSLKLSLDNTALKGDMLDKLVTLLYHNRDLFVTSVEQLPPSGANVPPFRIDTQGALPYCARRIRHTPEQRREIERQVKQMLDVGIIKPISSPWNSNVVLIRKGSSFRFCVDFRHLNSLCKIERFPLPTFVSLCDTISDQLAGSNSSEIVYSVMDLRCGFWQVLLSPEAAECSAFQTDSGCYSFMKMPFGMSNAPAHFQRIMMSTLQNLPFALAFIDDVLIVAKNASDMLEKLQQVFTRFRAARLRIHSEKCCFAVSSVKFLGHTFEGHSIKINADKMSIVKDYPVPKTVRQLRAYLGLATYFRRFIKSYSIISFPLRQLLRKNVAFVWNPACQEALDRIKYELLHAPTLMLAEFNKTSVLITDASVTG